jgi:hypothetical protein
MFTGTVLLKEQDGLCPLDEVQFIEVINTF